MMQWPPRQVNQDMRVTEWNSWLVQNIGLTKAYASRSKAAQSV